MSRVRFAPFAALLLVPAPVTASVVDVGAHPLERTHFTLDGRALPDHPHYRPRPAGRAAPAGTPAIGTVREWLGLNDRTGAYYRKKFRLRATGRHIEVWVALDNAFPEGDCRKNATEVTDPQITDLVREFDDTIYPAETAAFSTPPPRTGVNAQMAGDFTGDGDKTVTLVDNIRDENYFTYPKAPTYVAGFFSAQLNELFDRNVMTIDAYDWKHRLGAHPADDPTGDLCTSRPAHPRMYEGTFAHEWQHLLEYYADPEEASWANEGLSDFAQTLVGYVDPGATIGRPGNDVHLMCFQGWASKRTRFNPNPRDCGGPQNSLTLWDEGDSPTDVLADYGNAYQFMLYLRDRFGLDTISLLHRDNLRHGLAGVQAALPTGTSLYDVLHDYQLMTLVDKTAGKTIGVPIERVTAPSLRSSVNLDNPAAYAAPGVAPNGADYLRLPTPLKSVSFTGARTLPPLPTGWTIADKTFFSGNTDDLDAHAIRRVEVPATGATLRLETAYDIEEAYDWAYVTVSTDGGRTFQAISGDRTTAGPMGPGLTGASGGVVRASFDLSRYAGRKVLLGLRYVTDGAVKRGGWRIGQITLGDRVLSDGSTLDGWRSPSAIRPTPVHAWHVTLVGIDGRTVRVVPVKKFARLAAYPEVVAVVSYDEPTEKQRQYAPYQLVANGVVQPGGGIMP